ncbi:MAG: class I SAM-dependent methyltransferase [Candidatus Marinimicrobia bacterium]|nr:class I SAM-dependent methyltransferase [Candidatus Neomarinimicrobiota bacterium]
MSEDERSAVFNAAYEGQPPWDIGRPQPALLALEAAGKITGSVLDVGCGTGELALFFAEKGYDVWGIDSAPEAIRQARSKANQRPLQVSFKIASAMKLDQLDQHFDTVVDCGLFHVFSAAERPVFVNQLRSVLLPGGKYFMLCFSDREPGTSGPHRVSRNVIRSAFRDGWRIDQIQEARFETHIHAEGALAWLVSITRI